jgi:hypothetical protein
MADTEKTIVTSAAEYFGLFGLYLPITYILAGVLSDSISQRWSTSGASLSALLAVILNYIGSKFVDGVGFTTIKMQSGVLSGNAGNLTGIYSGCTVPGFEGYESILAPQSIVIIFAISTFFLIDITTNNPGQAVSGLIGLTIVATLIQVYVLVSNACWTSDFYVNWPTDLSFIKLASKFMIFPILFAGIFGVIGAGIGYGVSGVIKKSLIPPPPPPPPGPTGAGVTSSGGMFGSVLPLIGGSSLGGGVVGSSDDNQFVCEAYKNGELITSTITE